MSVIIWIPSRRRWITSRGLTRRRPMMSTRMIRRTITMPSMRPRMMRSGMSTLQKRIQSRCTRWRNTWSIRSWPGRPLRPIIVGRARWVCMLIWRLLSNWIIVRIRFTSGRLTVGRPPRRPHWCPRSRRGNWRWMWIHWGGLNAIDKMAVNMGSIWSRLWIRSRRQVSHWLSML